MVLAFTIRICSDLGQYLFASSLIWRSLLIGTFIGFFEQLKQFIEGLQ